MLKTEREQEIRRFIEENRRATVAELSAAFGVSEATIRRDLEKLDGQGMIRRTHGGAIRVEKAAPELPVIQRIEEQQNEKRRIGQAAADLVGKGETVFLGSGTTTLEVARSLVGKEHLTVITNALTVVNTLVQVEGITLLDTGGLLRASELSLIGHITAQTLQELRPQKVIMGIRAISLTEGLTNDYVPEVSTDRVIVRSAPEVILVADHTKFGKLSTAFVAPVTAVHKIVTDDGTPPDIVRDLEELGIEVIVA